MSRAIERAQVSKEPCKCIHCSMCSGSGRTRTDFSLSDFDTEPCEDCGGSGITDTCDRCQLLIDMDYEDSGRP